MDEAEFDEFYATSYARVVGHLYAITGDLQEAQDCVQEAFVRAWDRRRKLAALDAPEAWIRTVAWRIAASRWQRVKRGRELSRRAAAPTDTPTQPNPEHTALVAALRQLPLAQRVAIVLHHVCDLSVTEVARETGVPAGTVKARLSRGRAALAVALSDRDYEELRRA